MNINPKQGPKNGANYTYSVIYIISNTVNDIIYIGSTTSSIGVRFRGLIYASKSGDSPLYSAMREIGVGNFSIRELCKYPCENIDQLVKEEKRLIRKYSKRYELYNE